MKGYKLRDNLITAFAFICVVLVNITSVKAESVWVDDNSSAWDYVLIRWGEPPYFDGYGGSSCSYWDENFGWVNGPHPNCHIVSICASALLQPATASYTSGNFTHDQFGRDRISKKFADEAKKRGYSDKACFKLLKSFLSDPESIANQAKSHKINPVRLAFNKMTKTERISVQSNLKDLELYTKAIDGVYGRNTDAAIRSFNERYDFNSLLKTKAEASKLLNKILSIDACKIDINHCTDRSICRYATKWSGNLKSWIDGEFKALAEERGLNCGIEIGPDVISGANVTSESTKQNVLGQSDASTVTDGQISAEANPQSSSIPLTIDIVDAFYKSEDYKSALTYASILAMQGNGKAHRVLGDLYANGRGVLQLNQNAHMWYNVAALHGDTDAMAKRDTLSQTMTAESLAEAQNMALTCIQSSFKDCGLAELPEQVKIAVNSPQQRPKNQPALINGSEFQYSFASQSTLRRKQLQYAFKQLGLYSSSIDGIWGRGTSQAITNYIKLNDLQPRNGEELYMDVLSKVPVPNSFASNNARNVNRNTSNNAANRAAQQRQADMLINLGTSLMNSAIMPSSPSRSIDCYTYGNYTTCN